MKNKRITKFPKGFFQMKRPAAIANKVLKNEIPLKWKEQLKANKIRVD